MPPPDGGGTASVHEVKMFGFGMAELIVLMVVILIVCGPARLPRLGSALGSAMRNFKKGSEAPANVPAIQDAEGDAT
jgi:sec-independent protein translocase protein TatA